MRRLPALAFALLLGCFERGGAQPARTDDAAPAARPPLAAAPAAPADPDATVRVRLEAEPAHLNPLLAGDAIANRVALGDLYEGLLCADDPTGPPRPCLAETVEVDAAGTDWRIELRAGVTWHDGRPFGADDVLFTYQLLRAGALPSVLAADFDDLIEIAATGPRGGRMRFAGLRVGRRGALARVPILPAHRFAGLDAGGLAAAPANLSPVGTGPLRFVDWRPEIGRA